MIHQRSISYRTIAVFMATWMLAVSLGATVDMHFCHDHLVDYKIWGKAHNCGMMDKDQMVRACPDSTPGIDKPKCCEQKTHQLYFDQTNAGAQHHQQWTPSAAPTILAILPGQIEVWKQQWLAEAFICIPVHGPPLQLVDRTVLYATFLC